MTTKVFKSITFFLLILFVATSNVPVIAVPQPQNKVISWERDIEFSNDNLRSVVFGNGIYVVVGENGTVLVSKDKIKWNAVLSDTASILSDVIWTGNMFIAVGKEGTILTSKDGTHWGRQKSGSTGALRSIAYSGKRFVIVGDSGEYLVSVDGFHWESREHFKDIFKAGYLDRG